MKTALVSRGDHFLGYERGGPEISFPLFGRQFAAHVAAVGVVPLYEIVLLGSPFVFGDEVSAIACRGHGGAYPFGPDEGGLRIFEVELQVVDPVEVNVARQNHGVGNLPFVEEAKSLRRLTS